MSSSKPEKTIRVGSIQFSIWSNDSGKGVFQSITIDKSYLATGGNPKNSEDWKRTKSFKPADLDKLKLGLGKVSEYLYLKPDVITPKTDTPTPDF